VGRKNTPLSWFETGTQCEIFAKLIVASDALNKKKTPTNPQSLPFLNEVELKFVRYS
jgi:hypothetical protein